MYANAGNAFIKGSRIAIIAIDGNVYTYPVDTFVDGAGIQVIAIDRHIDTIAQQAVGIDTGIFRYAGDWFIDTITIFAVISRTGIAVITVGKIVVAKPALVAVVRRAGITIIAGDRGENTFPVDTGIRRAGIAIIAEYGGENTFAIDTGIRSTRVAVITCHRCVNTSAIDTFIYRAGITVIAIDRREDTSPVNACIQCAGIFIITNDGGIDTCTIDTCVDRAGIAVITIECGYKDRLNTGGGGVTLIHRHPGANDRIRFAAHGRIPDNLIFPGKLRFTAIVRKGRKAPCLLGHRGIIAVIQIKIPGATEGQRDIIYYGNDLDTKSPLPATVGSYIRAFKHIRATRFQFDIIIVYENIIWVTPPGGNSLTDNSGIVYIIRTGNRNITGTADCQRPLGVDMGNS
jgi:hypothetical protein